MRSDLSPARLPLLPSERLCASRSAIISVARGGKRFPAVSRGLATGEPGQALTGAAFTRLAMCRGRHGREALAASPISPDEHGLPAFRVEVPAEDVRRRRRAGARRDHADERAPRRPRRPRVPLHGQPRRRQDLDGAHPRQGAQLPEREGRASPATRASVCAAISAGEDIDVLEIDGASNRGIDEIRQICATTSSTCPARSALQDLHHRRSPHADRRRRSTRCSRRSKSRRRT